MVERSAGNSATPFENPNIWSNFIEMGSMMLLPMSMLFLFGRMLDRMATSTSSCVDIICRNVFHFYSNSYINYVE